jgi:hypothetical protein
MQHALFINHRERTLTMTTILAHTPGPWDCDLDYIVAPDPNGRHPDIYIAEIAHSDDEGRVATYEQQTGNRQLITAAPEMLAALLFAQGALNTAPRFRVGETDSYNIAAIVDKAIATATVVND